MTIQILQVPGAGQAHPSATPSSATPGESAFSLDLARAAARPLDGASPAMADPQGPPMARPATPATVPPLALILHPATSLGRSALPEAAASPLAAIAERLAPIRETGEQATRPFRLEDAVAPPPDGRIADPTELADTATPAAETASATEAVPAATAASLPFVPPVEAHVLPARGEPGSRPGQAGGERPIDPPAPLAALLNAPTGQGRPTPEGLPQGPMTPDTGTMRPAAVAPAEAQALPAGREAAPVAGASQGEGLPLTAAASNGPAPASPPSPPAGAAQAQPALTAPLNGPAWPQQLGQQLVVMGQRGGEQRVELHLHPAELGPLSISLKVHDQSAQAQFLSAHAPVRHAVEQAIPQLREALAEQGIALGETSVGEQHRDDGDARQLAGGLGSGGRGEAAEETESSAPVMGSPVALGQAGRVDLYA